MLNAYYLPGANVSEILYPSITPVNTFWVIFNNYFGTNLDLLPDKNYVLLDERNPYYKYVQVAEMLRERNYEKNEI